MSRFATLPRLQLADPSSRCRPPTCSIVFLQHGTRHPSRRGTCSCRVTRLLSCPLPSSEAPLPLAHRRPLCGASRTGSKRAFSLGRPLYPSRAALAAVSCGIASLLGSLTPFRARALRAAQSRGGCRTAHAEPRARLSCEARWGATRRCRGGGGVAEPRQQRRSHAVARHGGRDHNTEAGPDTVQLRLGVGSDPVSVGVWSCPWTRPMHGVVARGDKKVC